MGFLDKVFGGTETKQKQMELLTPEQRSYLDKMYGWITPQIGKGIEPYPGQMYAGPSPLMERYWQQWGAGGPTSSAVERALTGEPDMGAVEDYWTKAFYQPAMRQFTQDVLPQLREGFVGAGAFDSGGRRRAETTALADLFTNLQGQRAGLMFGQQQSALDRALQAVPLMSGMGAAGTMQQQMGQLPLSEAYEKWQMSQPWANPYLNMGQNLLNVHAFQPYLEQSTPWYGQLGQALLSGGTTALGMGGGFGLADWLRPGMFAAS